jgi:hypothetical protein
VADLTREELQRLARLGAQSRLEEIRREEAAIRSAFPDLVGERRRRRPKRSASTDAHRGSRRRRSTMSAAARKAVSERMTEYWASRRKAAK